MTIKSNSKFVSAGNGQTGEWQLATEQLANWQWAIGNRQPVASGQRRGIRSRRVERSSGEAREPRKREWKRHTVCLLHKAQEYKGKWEKCLRKSTAQQRFECGNCCKDSASEMAINLSQMSAGRWRGGRSKTRKSAERRCNGLVGRQTQPTSSTTRTPNLIETSKEPCQGSKAARQQQRQQQQQV